MGTGVIPTEEEMRNECNIGNFQYSARWAVDQLLGSHCLGRMGTASFQSEVHFLVL